MSQTSINDSSLAALQNDMAALKRDVSSMVEHIRTGAAATAQNAASSAQETAGQIGEGARKVYRDVASSGESSVKAIGQQIEQQPLIAVLIAAGLGFLGGRLLSR